MFKTEQLPPIVNLKLPTIVLTEPHNVRTILVDAEIIDKSKSKSGRRVKASKKYRRINKNNTTNKKKKVRKSDSKIITEKAN